VKKITSIFLISLAINTVIYGQTVSFPRLQPEKKALEYYDLGSRNNGFTWMELAQISLWASGDSSPAANIEKIRQTAQAINNSSDFPVSKKEKAEFIFTYLHRNILKTYSIIQTRVDTVFTSGRYNCVSSAVLYMILCDAAGIETSGVVTKDHAFVTVHIDGENIDVETTNRFGFDPGNRKDFHDQFGRSTGFAYVPARNYRDRQTINGIELVSLILNNRISELERSNRYSEAVPLSVDRTALLIGGSLADTYVTNSQEVLFEDPREDLMDRLFNYGAWLLKANKEEDCLRWVVAASSIYADTDRWQECTMAAVNNRIARYIKENKVTEGRNFLENQKIPLTEANYSQLDSIVTDAELLRRADQISSAADGEAVVSAIEQARNKIGEKRTAEIRTFAIQKTAAVLSAAPQLDWRAAIQYLEISIAAFGTNRNLEQSLRNYQENLVSDYHNRFAYEWNRKNYDEAEIILSEGLVEFPNNRQLLSDREIISRNR
jgi:hypothetical protein